MLRRLKALIGKLRFYGDRWWFTPAVCLLAFVDLFVLVIPNEIVVIMSGLVRPHRWFITGVGMSFASAVGAVVLALLAHKHGESMAVHVLGPHVFTSHEWLRTSHWIEKHGFWGMWFSAVGPLPMQPGALICGLAHMSSFKIFWAAFFGRLPKYVTVGYLTKRSPDLFRKKLDSQGALSNTAKSVPSVPPRKL